jgi:type I protein arginine methyltransferase
MSYSLLGFRKMVDDAVRMQAYATALQHSVRPGMSVLDIGAGTGVMSLLACRFGASRVVAVEPDKALLIAEANAKLNGLESHVEFVRGTSTEVVPGEKFDIVVSDLHGILPAFRTHFATIRHACSSLLKPGGLLIPGRDTLFAAVTEAWPEAPQTPAWDPQPYRLDLSADQSFLRSTPQKSRVSPESLLSPAGAWLEIDYAQYASDDCRGMLRVECLRPGIARGIVLWFQSELVPGVVIDNAPSQPAVIYGSLYLPLSAEVSVDTNNMFNIEINARYKAGDYQWNWHTQIIDKQSGQVCKDLRQSDFLAAPIDPHELRRLQATHVPKANDDCQIDRYILEAFDSAKTNRDIAGEVQARFAQRFETMESALNRVYRLAAIYAQ